MGHFASWRLGQLEVWQEAELTSPPSSGGERIGIVRKG